MSGETQELTRLWMEAMNGSTTSVLRLLAYNNIRYIRIEDIKLIYTTSGKPSDPEQSYRESIEVYMSNLKLTLVTVIRGGEVQGTYLIIEPLYCRDYRD